ncbi:MAG TPA: DUF4331 family protein [Myxococcota bacterium]|jgi:hypothetical protein|nr:DUF4331 family protein [Myxococcota bacterium]
MKTNALKGTLVGLAALLVPGLTGCDCHKGTDSGVTPGTDSGGAVDSGATDSGGGTVDSGTGDAGTAAAPVLKVYASTHMVGSGTQLDRIGRPGINTALIPGAMHDTYNADADPTMWGTNWTATITAGMSAADGIDGMTGNRLTDVLGVPDAVIAPILADDRLLIDTGIATCGEYLSRELALLGTGMNQCGGRPLAADVMDVSLEVLVAATLTDNVPTDSVFLLDWPFLAPAN